MEVLADARAIGLVSAGARELVADELQRAAWRGERQRRIGHDRFTRPVEDRRVGALERHRRAGGSRARQVRSRGEHGALHRKRSCALVAVYASRQAAIAERQRVGGARRPLLFVAAGGLNRCECPRALELRAHVCVGDGIRHIAR